MTGFRCVVCLRRQLVSVNAVEEKEVAAEKLPVELVSTLIARLMCSTLMQEDQTNEANNANLGEGKRPGADTCEASDQQTERR